MLNISVSLWISEVNPEDTFDVRIQVKSPLIMFLCEISEINASMQKPIQYIEKTWMQM